MHVYSVLYSVMKKGEKKYPIPLLMSLEDNSILF